MVEKKASRINIRFPHETIESYKERIEMTYYLRDLTEKSVLY